MNNSQDSSRRPSAKARKKAAPAPEFSDVEINLGNVLRAAYVEARSAFETYLRGTVFRYKVPRLYDKGSEATEVDGVITEGAGVRPLWPRLAKKFLELEIDPVEYTHCVFGYATDTHAKTSFGKQRPPEPNQLLSKTWLDYYRHCEASDVNGQLIKAALLSQGNTAMREISYLHVCGKQTKLYAQFNVLMNPHLELSALFRYCLARELSEQHAQFERVANLYEQRAAVQFWKKKKHYLKHWHQLLPADFVAKAGAIYAETFGTGA